MELIYNDSDIVAVRIQVPALENGLTAQEKVEFFGCDAPNSTVWQNIAWLEVGARNDDGTPKTTLQLTVQSMVTEGLITQQRADDILS